MTFARSLSFNNQHNYVTRTIRNYQWIHNFFADHLDMSKLSDNKLQVSISVICDPPHAIDAKLLVLENAFLNAVHMVQWITFDGILWQFPPLNHGPPHSDKLNRSTPITTICVLQHLDLHFHARVRAIRYHIPIRFDS